MKQSKSITRRNFIAKSTALGCSLAASPLVTPITLAAAPWDNRLVVIILRGGMDGLDVVQPYGDPDHGARPTLTMGEAGGAHDLDGFFSMHRALGELAPLWHAEELAFAHAVSTPYRDKRSHFDGQDLLEAGTGFDVAAPVFRDGWLNRLLQVVPGVQARTGFAVGRENMLILSGQADHSTWAPDTDFDMSDATRQLLEMTYHDDPIFREAAAEALSLAVTLNPEMAADSYEEALDSMQQTVRSAKRGDAHKKIAEFAADRLLEETRVAAFSINGWDTHARQTNGLNRPLAQLSDTILTLKDRLGPVWGKTAVLAMTEFGRTVRENGTGGTDHGTGGAMIMAGGAIKGGRVYTDWPGLAEAALYQRRDLMPTQDVRAYAGVAMRGLFGMSAKDIETSIFPGLEMNAVPNFIA